MEKGLQQKKPKPLNPYVTLSPGGQRARAADAMEAPCFVIRPKTQLNERPKILRVLEYSFEIKGSRSRI